MMKRGSGNGQAAATEEPLSETRGASVATAAWKAFFYLAQSALFIAIWIRVPPLMQRPALLGIVTCTTFLGFCWLSNWFLRPVVSEAAVQKLVVLLAAQLALFLIVGVPLP